MVEQKSSSTPKSERKLSNENALADNLNLITRRKVEMVPPDGGWGWVVVFGSVVYNILGSFPGMAFSILFSPILMAHEVSKTKIAWIFNIRVLTLSCCALLIGPLCQEIGHRKVAFFMGIVNCISMILSTIAPSADFLFFSYGILGGIGASGTYNISFFMVSKYFKKHLGFANGIVSLGVCGSSFLAPVVANYLLQNFDYKGASLIFAAIMLNQCVGATFFQPVEWHMKLAKPNQSTVRINECAKSENANEEAIQIKLLGDDKVGVSNSSFPDENSQSKIPDRKSHALIKDENLVDKNNFKATKLKNMLIVIFKSTYKNFRSLKNMRVQFIAWAHCGYWLGFTNFLMWVPFVIIEEGYSLETAAWCSSLASIGNVSGRIILTVIADRKFFNVKYGLIFGYFITGSSIIAFSIVKEIKLYLSTVFIWGMGIGISGALGSTSMIRTMGVEMFPAVLGVSALLHGLCSVTLGVLTGVVRDVSIDYTYSLWILAGGVYIAFFLWLFMPFAEKFDKKKSGLREKKQKNENI